MKKLLSVVLAVSMLLSLCTAFTASAEEATNNIPSTEVDETIYANGKVWFDLNGNSKLFINAESEEFTNRADKTDYVPGLDYSALVKSPTGDFNTDKNALYSSGERISSFFPYTVNKGTTPKYGTKVITDFKKENDNTYWTIDNVDYLVRPTKKVIKLVAGVNTNNIADETLKARFSTLAETTVDVKDGYYNKIGFVADMHGTYNRYVSVTLVYEDEEVTTDKKVSSTSALSSDYNFSTGSLFFERLSDTTTSYWTADWHTFKPYDVQAESSKKLVAVKFTATKKYGDGTKESSYLYPTRIISLWGEEQTLDEKITALDTLNTADITTTDSYNAVKDAVEDIEKYLVNYSVSLTEEQKAVVDTAKANLNNYEVTLKTANDNLAIKSELEFKGNSKLFMNAESSVYADRTNYKDYAPGLDYGSHTTTPYADFDSDYTTVAKMVNTDGFGVFPYTINKGTVATNAVTIPDFSKGTDDNIYWNIDNVDYLIKPEEKVIKLVAGTSLYNLKDDAEAKAKYDSLNGVTIDITDGKYESVGFLAGIYSQSYTRNLYVTLVYEDGEEIETSYPVTGRSSYTNTFATGGVLYQPLSSNTDLTSATTSSSQYWHSFTPVTVPANNTKTLVSIKVEPDSTKTTYRYPLYVISAWKTHTIKNALSAVTANTSKADAKVILSAVDAALAENDITADDLTDETKAKYELAKACANSLEVTSASFADSKVNVSYKTGTDTAVKVIVAEYEDENETLFKKVTILPAELTADKTSYEAAHTATGAKVKVFVWKDMVNFFPYY